MKGHKTAIKLVIIKEEDMSADGYAQWNSKLRGHVRKKVYKFEMNLSEHFPERAVPVILINTKRKIIALVERFCGVGTWILRGFSHGKNTYRIKQIRLAKVIVMEHGEKFKSLIETSFRLPRYWFWQESDNSHLLRSYPRPDNHFDDSVSLRRKEFKGVGDG